MVRFLDRLKKLQIGVRKKIFSQFLGSYRSWLKGQGVEAEDLREYVFGDNAKYIDWNTYAKTNKLYIKKYKEDKDMNILFAIDVSSSMATSLGSQQLKQNLLFDVLTCLAFASEGMDSKFGALLFNNQRSKYISFKKGRQQSWNIIKNTYTFLKRNYLQKNAFTKFYNFCEHKLRKRSIIFLITDSLKPFTKNDEQHFKNISRKHELIVIYLAEGNLTIKFPQGNFQLVDVESNERIQLDLDNPQTNQLIQSFYLELLGQIKSHFKKCQVKTIYLYPSSNLLLELIKFFNSSKKLIHYE